MPTITPRELHHLLSANPNLPLIDVRTGSEFSEVHVPQARNFPLGQFQGADLNLPAQDPVYILCHAGGRATKAAQQLSVEGFHQPVVVEGGTQAWIDAGLPVNRGKAGAISLERQVRIAAGSLVLVGVLLGFFVNRWFFGLSGFVGAGLIFAGITDFCGMGLLLARAPWNAGPRS